MFGTCRNRSSAAAIGGWIVLVAASTPVRVFTAEEVSGARSPAPYFVPNRGQFGTPVDAVARARGYTVFLAGSEAVFVLDREGPVGSDDDGASRAIRMRLERSRVGSRWTGTGPIRGKSHWFLGSDPTRWVTDVPHHDGARLDGAWPGVDVVFRSKGRELEYDFHVEAGADVASISFGFEGAGDVEVDSAGDLIVRAGSFTLRHRRPEVWEEDGMTRRPLSGRFVVTEGGTVRFAVDGRDPSVALVIDPVIHYSTFLGGATVDQVEDIAVDPDGSAYIAGYTESIDFPYVDPVFAEPAGGVSRVAFVTKLSPDGTEIEWSSYLGASQAFGLSHAYGVGLDASGGVWVGGDTFGDFPLVDPVQETFGGVTDAFLARLSPAGDELLFSTYLGGPQREEVGAIVVDPNGAAYIAGKTSGSQDLSGLPVVNAPQPEPGDTFRDAFAAKLLPDRSAFAWVTYLGGSDTDEALAIAAGADGEAIVAGTTRSGDFPVVNAHKSQRTGRDDGFVVRIAANGNVFRWATYFGGEGDDIIHGAALDGDGRVVITGIGGGATFPIAAPLSAPRFGPFFVSRLLADGSAVDFSTLVCPTAGAFSWGTDIAVGGDGRFYITGNTAPNAFPLVEPTQPVAGGVVDAFLCVIDPDDSEIDFSTFAGGAQIEFGEAVAVGSGGRAWIGGMTSSADFPVTEGAADPAPSGSEGFVVAIDTSTGPQGPPFLTLDVPVDVELTAAAPDVAYRLATAPGSMMRIDVEALNGTDPVTVHARWDEAASRDLFDLAADAPNFARQVLFVPEVRDGVLWLLAGAARVSGASTAVRILAREVELAISAVYVRRSPAGAPVTTRVRGAGFGIDTRFLLRSTTTPVEIEAERVRVFSREEADLTFDLDGVPEGEYRVTARAEIGGELIEAAQEDVFEVTEAVVTGVFEAELNPPPGYRAARNGRLTIDWRNSGDRAIPAPLLVLEGPEGALFRLESETLFSSGAVSFLALDPFSPDSLLSPGASGRVAVIFRLPEVGPHPIRLRVLHASEADWISWDTMDPPPGVDPGEWNVRRDALSVSLGPTWKEYSAALARRANRLVLRGGDPSSAAGAFADLWANAGSDLAYAGISGRVVESETFAPVPFVLVGAIDAGEVISRTRTDRDGYFALGCLTAGRTYTIGVENKTIADASVPMPLDGSDATARDFVVTGDTPAPIAAPRSSCLDGAPPAPLLPPAEFFTDIARATVDAVRSVDPNEKNGPEGDGPERFVPIESELRYTIHFENRPDATAPAQRVVIEDDLDPAYDWSTFRILDARVGETVFSLDTVRVSGIEVPRTGTNAVRIQGGITPDSEWSGVRVRTDFDSIGGRIRWVFETIDPVTEELPPDASVAGFLPPNDAPPRGEATVSFAVRPRADLTEGDPLENEARIIFDDQETITTRPAINRIGYRDLPFEVIDLPFPGNDLDHEVSPTLFLDWPETVRGSTYDVYVWADGAQPGEPVARDVDTSHWVPAAPLDAATTYHWRVTARDRNGNEVEGPVWSFRTLGEAPDPPGAPRLESPLPDASGIALLPELSFVRGAAADVHAIFVWPEVEPRPEVPLATGVAGATFRLGRPLRGGTRYLWQVVALNRGGETPSEIAAFTTTAAGALFRRGDSNADGTENISDAIHILQFLFSGGAEPTCRKAADLDDDGRVQITDPIVLLNFLFLGGIEPRPPFGECGVDPTVDLLPCADHPPCR